MKLPLLSASKFNLLSPESYADTLCYTFEHRSWFKDEGGQGHPAQIGTRSQLRDDMHEHCGWLHC